MSSTQTLTSASAELNRRPSDEHLTLPDFRCQAGNDRLFGREIPVAARAVLFTEQPSALGGVALDVGSGPAAMTHYTLSQACQLAGTSPGFLDRVLPPTRARILNEALNRSEITDRVALYDTNKCTIRAMTSTSYVRLWDADIMENVERWLLPQGWIPAVPTFRKENATTDKPALFRGDRDSYQFYYSPQSDRPDLGGLRRGVVVYNSEVGARSFGFDTFLFRDVCGNFLIWGAEQVTRKRARHVGRVTSLFADFRRLVQSLSCEMDSESTRCLEAAAIKMFAEATPKESGTTNAINRLVRQYSVGKADAASIVKAAEMAVNQGDGLGQQRFDNQSIDYFAIANGASWLAHEQSNASDRMALATLSGEILASATEGA